MAQPRIPRDATDPVFKDEDNPAYSVDAKVTDIGGGMHLRTLQTDWEPIDFDFEEISTRTICAALRINGEHAGSFKFVEYSVEPFVTKEDFFYWADGDSHATGELAGVVSQYWDDLSDLTDYGSILDLRRAWIAPRYSRDGNFGVAARALVEQSAENAIIVLKAFPLEYECKVDETTSGAHRRRRAAMMRHYRRELCVEAFPGFAGEDGWMFAIPAKLGGLVPPPRLAQNAVA